MDKVSCAACGRLMDAAAKLCPYCGANPSTGERVDTEALLQEVFHPREVTRTASVLEYARQRQGVVIAISLIVAFVVLAALHQFVTMRNSSDVTAAPAVPLTEVTDLSRSDESTPQTMPDLDFEYQGHPRAMRTYVVEAGAVLPPEVIAAQQAAAQARAAQTPRLPATLPPLPPAGTPRQGTAPYRPGVLPVTPPAQTTTR